MATPLLATKLFIPRPRPDLVPRPRLAERLADGATRKLTLVAAPAGFGKTTLLSAWAQQDGRAVAWLSLEAEDNDPAQFLTYVVAALQQISAGVGQGSLALLRSSPPPPFQVPLVTLINELAAVPDDFYLVLDDYHLIEAREVHEVVATLVENGPPGMHLLMSSRSDPPLPLSRLRVRDQLAELRQADLRFTADEAAHFLSQTIGLALSPGQVAALEARTEGWIAGLQLAALSMRGAADVPAFIRDFSGSHRFVIDYLAEEVLAQQPDDLRRFLAQTAILDRFTAGLCDELTGRHDAATLLKRLEDANLFLIPLDDQRHWYRYHALFRDFLRYQLEEEEAKALHRAAAAWFASRELFAEAMRHAIASADAETIVSVAAAAVPAAFNLGSLTLLLRWLEAIPQDRLQRSASLATWKGFALYLTGQVDEAVPYAAAAQGALAPDTADAARGQLMLLQAHLAMCRDDLDHSIRLAREALELLDPQELSFRNLAFNLLGQVLELKGDVAAAAGVYEQAFQLGWRSGDLMGALVVFTNLVFSLNELGRRRQAAALCDRLAAEIQATTLQGLPLAAAVDLPRSLLSLEADDLEAAAEQAQRALDLLTAANFNQGILWAQYILARVHLARHELKPLFQAATEGRRLAAQVGRDSLQGAWFAALEAQADLLRGNLIPPVRWADAAGFSPDDTPTHWMEYAYFTYVRLLLAQDRLAEAERLLRTMRESAEAGGRLRKLITVHLLLARLSAARRDPDAAAAHLQGALELAAPQDYRRPFLDEGEQMIRLLAEIRPAAPDFVDALLGSTDVRPAPAAGSAILLDTLSERELELLRLVARGLSNREIAAALYITLGTVKKHLNNIFSKLDAGSRTQAVAAARELRLID